MDSSVVRAIGVALETTLLTPMLAPVFGAGELGTIGASEVARRLATGDGDAFGALLREIAG